VIIVCTGITGSGRKQVISSMVDLARKNGVDIQIKNIGQMMYDKAEEGGYMIEAGKILDLPEFTLRPLRWSVLEDVLRTIDEAENTIIDTHACFRWKKYICDGFEYSYLSKLNPDIYFNVMDTIYSIKGRLGLLPGWNRRHNLLELLIWRDEEEALTRTFAQIQQRPFYLIFFTDPAEVMYRIAFEGTAKGYLSYPISFATEEQINAVIEFRDELRREIVVFDPLGIREMGWLSAAIAMQKQGNEEIAIPFTVNRKEETVKLSVTEIQKVREYLVDQTINRDFTLIDQSDFVVVDYFDPEINSPGVNNEMQYAHDTGKNVYIYWPFERMSPFLKRNITQSFRTQENLIRFIKEQKMPSTV
jgi:adenylate kinase